LPGFGQLSPSPVAHDHSLAGKRRVAGINPVERLLSNEVHFSARPSAEQRDGVWIDGASVRPLALASTFQNDRPLLFYYLRVIQANRQQAWSSPIWLTLEL
jgi:hypothetical protein